MSIKRTVNIALNRVEGDLKLKVEVEDGVVNAAYSSGTMYRGFERMLIDRAPLDSLVITPRICGICTSAHLNAAAKALDMVSGAKPPANAIIVRNLTMITEILQSDIRHSFLMFMPDFINNKYRKTSFFEEANERYQPFKGTTVRAVIHETKKLLEIIATLGGQWPHSAHIVPGGVTSLINQSDILLCSSVLRKFKMWYERWVLGCSIERWSEVETLEDLDAWLKEDPKHYNSDLGLYLRIADEAGLEKIGRGHNAFISYGCLDLPDGKETLWPAGFMHHGELNTMDQENISEHVAHSRFADYEGGKHPFHGETVPLTKGGSFGKYSWCKAPRYNDLPAETGPLAEQLIASHPLISDMYRQQGPSVKLRQFARLIRPALLLPIAEKWFEDIAVKQPFYNNPGEIQDGEGYGLIQAPRGALGHWVKIKDSIIAHYQIITPTSWNASPRDSNNCTGPWEEALVGTLIMNPDNPVEVGHVVRSYDACLVCSVHSLVHKKGSLPHTGKTFKF